MRAVGGVAPSAKRSLLLIVDFIDNFDLCSVSPLSSKYCVICSSALRADYNKRSEVVSEFYSLLASDSEIAPLSKGGLSVSKVIRSITTRERGF